MPASVQHVARAGQTSQIWHMLAEHYRNIMHCWTDKTSDGGVRKWHICFIASKKDCLSWNLLINVLFLELRVKVQINSILFFDLSFKSEISYILSSTWLLDIDTLSKLNRVTGKVKGITNMMFSVALILLISG